MTLQQKMWAWHTWNHMVSIIGLALIVVNGLWGYLAIALLLGFVSCQVANVALHRYLCHRSFETGYYRDLFLRYVSVYAGLGSPILWVVTHRQHHAASDTDADHQNPRTIGKLRSWFTVYPTISFNPRFGKDIMRCAHSRFIHDHYFAIQFALYALCFIINPYLAVILLAIPMTITFHGAASIGVLTHTWGYRIAETTDKSTNNWLAAIMSGGEGWHNYHHAHPSDHRNGYRWWELDPPAWIIERFFKC